LTQVLSYFGWGFDQSVASSYLKPNIEDKNVSPGQMVEFVNHQQQDMPNLRALWRYGGTIELIKEVWLPGSGHCRGGYDVQDLGWMGHYETVVAYDDLLLHFGFTAFWHWHGTVVNIAYERFDTGGSTLTVRLLSFFRLNKNRLSAKSWASTSIPRMPHRRHSIKPARKPPLIRVMAGRGSMRGHRRLS
jgi:hypothetical protein